MEQYNKTLKKLPQTSTYGDHLTTLGKRMFGKKYKGTFPSDKIPSLTPMQSSIINLDDSSQGGSHWVVYARGKQKQHYMYDSFGRQGVKLIPKLKKNKKNITDAELDPEQHYSEVNCGARCLAWLDVYYKQGIKKALTI
tara:strand:+ start:632 stop:1048 length:417 start_codon:yes stop_codon:yes gene_type:complete